MKSRMLRGWIPTTGMILVLAISSLANDGVTVSTLFNNTAKDGVTVSTLIDVISIKFKELLGLEKHETQESCVNGGVTVST